MPVLKLLRRTLVAFGSIAVIAGCGYQPPGAEKRARDREVAAARVPQRGWAQAQAPMFDSLNFGTDSSRIEVFLTPSDAQPIMGHEETQPAQASAPGTPQQADENRAPAALRKIIYTAQVSLVVEDFSEVEQQVAQLVQQFDGYVAASQVDSTQSVQRSGRWVLRIPVDRFDSFIDRVVQLGVPETRQTNAQDVTEEFVDLEARLANKQQIEQRILKLLEERSGDIKDVIAVETELGRVREEIERMQGRHRYLSNQTAMTTVTVSAREERNYVPPQAPTFAGLIGKTWGNSWTALGSAGKGLVIAAVALAPWMMVVLPVGTILWWAWRRRHRMVGAQPVGS